MGTKENPARFDCYANAMPDEPMFVLLARDPLAPDLVREWVKRRADLMQQGLKPQSDIEMLNEATSCAYEMSIWRENNYAKWRDKK